MKSQEKNKKMERGKISSLQMAILMYQTIIATGIIFFIPGFTANGNWSQIGGRRI